MNVYLKHPTFKPDQDVFVKIREIYHPAKVITLPARENNIYTLQLQHDNSIHQFTEDVILDHDPYIELSNDPTHNKYFPKWLKHGANITIKLKNSQKYQHGELLLVGDQYFFRPGRSTKKNPKLCIRCLRSHPSYKKIRNWIHTKYIGERIANHISAQNLSSTDVPTLIQHHRLNPTDKDIWDSAYGEEYYGLTSLPIWATITEAEYQRIKHKTGRPLPTMVVSAIKFDENGLPKRAKYRIVVLGNLDPHSWSKSDTYAPVLSLVELRIMCILAIHYKRILKQGDFKQAFVQATLPDDEQYVVRPPHGCPISEPNTYWLLKRTLYGLKRSPKHCFDRAATILKELGLQPLPNAPCIFKGKILQNEPELTLGHSRT